MQLFLIIYFFANSQIPTWIRQYGSSDRAEFAFGGIVETPDSGFVVAGGTWSDTIWDKDGYIIKIDNMGETLWTRRIGSMGIGAGGDFIWDVILNSNNELVFTGTRYKFPLSKQVWFLKYNLDGNLLTEKIIGETQEENGCKILQNPDGTYMIVGDTKSRGSQIGGKDVWLLKLNQEGETIWTKTYDLLFKDQGSGIIPFGNGNYLITAFSCTGQWLLPPAYMGFASYFIIDSLGNVLKMVKFDEDSLTSFSNIRPTGDCGAIITGSRSATDIFPNRDIWVLKLDANADTVWTKTIGTYRRYDGGCSIFQSDNGGYYLAAYSQGYTPPGMEYDNWWLLRLDDAGETLWTRWWGGPLNDDPYSVMATADGGIIISGWRDANSSMGETLTIGNADFYVIKADTNGCVNAIETRQAVNIKSPLQLHIHPNPFNLTTSVQFSLSQPDYVRLKIYDARGGEIATLIDGHLNAGGHKVIYQATGQPNGVFLCRFEVGNRLCSTQKLLHLAPLKWNN
ncbi:MAG: hypothetical protein ABIK23_04610 [candidate division WOR-3 bacterium]